MKFIYDKTYFFDNINLLYNLTNNEKIFMVINLDSYIDDKLYDHLHFSTVFEVYYLPNNIEHFLKIFPDLHNIISHYPYNSKTIITLSISESYYSENIIQSSISILKIKNI